VTKRSFLWARGRPIWSFLFSPKGRNGNAVSVRLSRAVISNTARAYFGSPESYKKLFVSHGDVHDADAAGEPFSGSDLLLSAACSNGLSRHLSRPTRLVAEDLLSMRA
jgi:hypothetical protein